MLAEAHFDPEGKLSAPHIFSIQLHPEQAEAIANNQHLLEQIEHSVMSSAEQVDIALADKPVLNIVAVETLAKDEIRVRCRGLEGALHETQALASQVGGKREDIPSGAFLIVNGAEIFALDRVIINIGRKSDNHLVLEDGRISRRHGQLRAIAKEYHFFDLGSTGGSKINGQAIRRGVLAPGDVLNLAGVPLIYGQDEAAKHAQTQEVQTDEERGDSGPTEKQANED